MAKQPAQLVVLAPPRPGGWRGAPGWIVALLAGAVLVALPLGELIGAALDEGAVAMVGALGGAAAVAIADSILVSAAATALAVAIGSAAAWVTERSAAPGRSWLRLGMLLPLVVPGFVTAAGWIRIYGPAGLLDRTVGLELPGLVGPVGIVAVLAVEGAPLAFLLVAVALAVRLEPDLERAARASGASAWRTALTVTIPLLGPAITAAAILVFVRSLNAFGVPAVLGLPAGFAMITTRLYRDLAFSAEPAAFTRSLALAVLLVVVALVLAALADLVAAERPIRRTGVPAGAVGRARLRSVLPVALLWAFVALTTILPLVGLVLAALTRAVGLPPLPENWTLANFGAAISGRTASALGNSLTLAAAAATGAVLLGALLAALARRGRRRAGALGTLATLTFAVPGSVLAVSVLLAYGPWLRDTLLLILVAYLAKFWALGHRPIAGALDRLPADLVRAARVSGAGPLDALASIVVPVLLPVIAGAWLLVASFGLHELTMSSMLYGPGTATLAVVVLNLQQLGDVGVTSALAVLLTAFVLVAALPLVLLRRAGLRLPTEP